MARRRPIALSLLIAVFCATSCRTPGDQATPATFAGETVRILVAFHAGGPFDLHGRLVAAHLSQHLPGHPAVVVENMGGAGGAIGANHLATQTKADGLTIGLLSQVSAVEAQASGVLDRFELLGSPGAPGVIMLFSARSGITSVDEWRRMPRAARFASAGATSSTSIVPRIAGAALGLPVQVVSGYSSASEERLAFDSGEVDAVSVTMDAYNTTYRASAGAAAVLRFSSSPIPEFDVPDAITVADSRARALLEVGVYAMLPMIRYYAAPKGIPTERLSALREGLEQTWADPEFLAEARAARLAIDPVRARELERILRGAFAQPDILSRLEQILRPH
jgi:tripartite-type tricarboxylate transporter receptor subunit TctC